MEKIYNKLVRDNISDSAKTNNNIIEKTSDVFEVLCAISELEGTNIDKVIETSNEKRLKKEGFTKKIFLVKSIKKD